MSGRGTLDSLRVRYEELVRALESAESSPSSADRESLRDGIVGLFRETEALVADLQALKESIRPLVDRYRELFPGGGPSGDGRGGTRADGEGAGAVPVSGAAAGPASGTDTAAASHAAPSAGPSAERPTDGAGDAGGTVRVDHLGSSTHIERGWNAIAGGNYGPAVDELRKALELAPGHARAEALLGWALMRDGRVAEARPMLEALLARDPENLLARANLGFVEMREGRFAEAIEHLAGVARSATDRTAALYAQLYLGMVYAEREMFRDAETLLTRALEMGPNLIEAYWELGRVHYLAGDPDAAAAAWRRGAETNRFNPWGERCAEAAERLAAGEPLSLG